MSSHLLIKPRSASGLRHSIYPVDVKDRCPNWAHVGFELYKLSKDQSLELPADQWERLLVIVTGKMTVSCAGTSFGEIGGRMDLFKREKTHAFYCPNDHSCSITATTDLELAVCIAPGLGGHSPRVIEPDSDPMEARGQGANTRYVNAIMMEDKDFADNLLVTEVWTPNGNWSSYPSHKHDADNYPHETYLEETYYHRLNPSQGFGYQRVYNDDLSLNENIAFGDGDVVLVPEGYHPAAAPYGYDLYYLNVMAGPMRKWRFTNDPNHEWIFIRDGGVKPSD